MPKHEDDQAEIKAAKGPARDQGKSATSAKATPRKRQGKANQVLADVTHKGKEATKTKDAATAKPKGSAKKPARGAKKKHEAHPEPPVAVIVNEANVHDREELKVGGKKAKKRNSGELGPDLFEDVEVVLTRLEQTPAKKLAWANPDLIFEKLEEVRRSPQRVDLVCKELVNMASTPKKSPVNKKTDAGLKPLTTRSARKSVAKGKFILVHRCRIKDFARVGEIDSVQLTLHGLLQEASALFHPRHLACL
jgi:hypothetical protein